MQLRAELRDLSQVDVDNGLKIWKDGHFISVDNRYEADQKWIFFMISLVIVIL